MWLEQAFYLPITEATQGDAAFVCFLSRKLFVCFLSIIKKPAVERKLGVSNHHWLQLN